VSLTKLLTENYKEAVDEVVNLIEARLDNNRLTFQDITDEYESLGEGTEAKVYEVNGKALRVESPATRYKEEIYEKLKGNEFEHVVKVEYNKVVKIGAIYYLLTVMEKLEPIDDNNKLSKLDDFSDRHEFPYKGDPRSVEEIQDIIMDINKGYSELEEIGITPTEIHTDNIMYDPKTEKYKIIDILDKNIN